MTDLTAFDSIPITVGFGTVPTTSVLRFHAQSTARYLVLYGVPSGTEFDAQLLDASNNAIEAPLPKPCLPEYSLAISFLDLPIGRYTYTLKTYKPNGELRVDEFRIEVLSDAESAAITAARQTPVAEPVQFEG